MRKHDSPPSAPRYWRFQQQHVANWPVLLSVLANLDENAGDFYAPGVDQLLGRPYTDFHVFDEMTMLMSAAHKAYHQVLISRINNRQCHTPR